MTDENGEVVDEWVSGKEPHIIKELVVGQTYTMTEVLPAPGYVTAESIRFTVEDTAEVQKIEMKDDVTKVEISKTDIAGRGAAGSEADHPGREWRGRGELDFHGRTALYRDAPDWESIHSMKNPHRKDIWSQRM